jgi:2-oxoglutarate dehydrogenase E1 component
VQGLYGKEMYLDYVGRDPSAAPAGGYMSAHLEEEKRFVNKALTV